jgi:hypothetical protein
MTSIAGRAGRYRGLAGGPRVAIVGDSITVLTDHFDQSVLGNAIESFAVHVGPAYRYAVSAASGHPIQDLQPRLSSILADSEGSAARAVLNVGTINMTSSDSNWQTHYDNIWTVVSGMTRVVLVTLTETNSIGTAINTYIATKASGNANVRVADWKAYQDAHPGDVLRFDAVHPTPLGADVLGTLIRNALDAA